MNEGIHMTEILDVCWNACMSTFQQPMEFNIPRIFLEQYP